MAGAWALEDGDWQAVRRHRDRALDHGAGEGALPERAHLWALDLGLALHADQPEKALEAVAKLVGSCKGYSERSFGELLAKVRTLAPPQLTEMLGGISTTDNP